MERPEPAEATSATVSVGSTIAMPGPDTFLVVADVLSGAVRPGMDLVVPVGSTAERKLRIHGVGPAVEPTGDRVGLAFGGNGVGATRRYGRQGDDGWHGAGRSHSRHLEYRTVA